jgi:hypothetical protein
MALVCKSSNSTVGVYFSPCPSRGAALALPEGMSEKLTVSEVIS